MPGLLRAMREKSQDAWWMHWHTMTRNPGVYVRGRITHPDHKTNLLDCWHRVMMNTESQSSAMRNLAFLD
jgi:hypothetical protein